ncbi:MAG: DNA polymerase domain-containing protein [Victivallaceae bacterium]
MQLDKLVPCEYRRVVAVEPGESELTVFFREDGQSRCQNIQYAPFILLKSPELLNGGDGDFSIIPLTGSAPMAYRVNFSGITAYLTALEFLKKSTGYNPSSQNAPFRVVSDLTQQALTGSGIRLFRDMNFNDVRRLQFDIETLVSPEFEFPNPEREPDEIIIITMSDNTGWEKVISLENMSEKELLETFVATVAERDPDVLEGHNIFRFDLPYIEERAKRHRVKLNLGRGGQPVKKRNSRFNAAERTINYTRYDIYGRHVIDTFHLCMLYDVSHRNLESYGLKYVAKHFGVAPDGRTYVEGREISAIWNSDRQRLLAYALDDVRETRAISEILSPSYFYQTQLIPMKYQDCAVRGNATCIDAMLVAEYLRCGQSLPLPESSRQFSGALTKAFEEGVFKNVWHCDIRSLYPSVILAEKWCPERDELGVFSRLLKELRTFRLQAKDAEKKAVSPAEKDQYNALQTTFKILINSFYGYLGFSQGTFNDYAMAENVTGRGREILVMMLDYLNESSAKVIEMDTDGIYFQPPPDVATPEAMERRVQSVLPSGIEVELDATYSAMFCYKSKNYALLELNGEVSITGAALKSRGLEPFQREFIERLISLFLREDYTLAEELYNEFRTAIECRKLPLEKLVKTETLGDSLDTYRKKLSGGNGRRSAAYELAIASGRDYRAGDQVSFYLTGDKKKASVVDNSKLLSDATSQRDENIPYYLNKLEELHKKFSGFIPAKYQQAELF